MTLSLSRRTAFTPSALPQTETPAPRPAGGPELVPILGLASHRPPPATALGRPGAARSSPGAAWAPPRLLLDEQPVLPVARLRIDDGGGDVLDLEGLLLARGHGKETAEDGLAALLGDLSTPMLRPRSVAATRQLSGGASVIGERKRNGGRRILGADSILVPGPAPTLVADTAPVDGGKRHPMSFIGSFRPICRCLHNLLRQKQYVGETKGYPSEQ